LNLRRAVPPGPFAVHADRNVVVGEHVSEGLSRELRTRIRHLVHEWFNALPDPKLAIARLLVSPRLLEFLVEPQFGVRIGAADGPETEMPDGSHPPVWFALDATRPLAFFAGIWTRWTSVRKVKEGDTTNDLFAFLTTEPNKVVGSIHPKAMPAILTTADEIDIWMTAPPEDALQLQRPLADDVIVIVARGEKEDKGGHSWSGELNADLGGFSPNHLTTAD
jgi:hypothetical protein